MARPEYATKQQIKVLYMRGAKIKDILSTYPVSSATLYKWINAESWKEERESYKEQLAGGELKRLFRADLKRREHLVEDLQMIREKAIHAIAEDIVKPTKFTDTANAYIASLKTENEIQESLLKSNFINIVVKVLAEEITDDDLFFRIGKRLQSLSSDRGSRQPYLLDSAAKEVREN